MFAEDLVQEINITLDKLIENAKAMENITLLEEEVTAFQKTQESLLSHLMHIDKKLNEKRKSLKIPKDKKLILGKKLSKFEKLNDNFIKNASQKIKLIKVRKIKKKN